MPRVTGERMQKACDALPAWHAWNACHLSTHARHALCTGCCACCKDGNCAHATHVRNCYECLGLKLKTCNSSGKLPTHTSQGFSNLCPSQKFQLPKGPPFKAVPLPSRKPCGFFAFAFLLLSRSREDRRGPERTRLIHWILLRAGHVSCTTHHACCALWTCLLAMPAAKKKKTYKKYESFKCQCSRRDIVWATHAAHAAGAVHFMCSGACAIRMLRVVVCYACYAC